MTAGRRNGLVVRVQAPIGPLLPCPGVDVASGASPVGADMAATPDGVASASRRPRRMMGESYRTHGDAGTAD